MQRRTGLTILGITIAVAACVVLTSAQEAKHVPLNGTITLRSGRTLQGDLLLVAFGVTEAARFGSDRREVDEGGKLEIDVNGETKTISGRDIATVEAEWKHAPRAPDAEAEWHITTLTVTTRDGQTVTGKPAWFMSMSEFILDPGGDQERVRVENYPLFRTTFDPDSLIAKVDLTGEAPGEVTPPALPPTRVEMPEVPPVPTPVVETPVVGTPGEETPGEVERPVVTPTDITPPPTPPEGVAESKPVSLTLAITCPHCGQRIVVTIDAHAP